MQSHSMGAKGFEASTAYAYTTILRCEFFINHVAITNSELFSVELFFNHYFESWERNWA